MNVSVAVWIFAPVISSLMPAAVSASGPDTTVTGSPIPESPSASVASARKSSISSTQAARPPRPLFAVLLSVRATTVTPVMEPSSGVAGRDREEVLAAAEHVGREPGDHPEGGHRPHRLEAEPDHADRVVGPQALEELDQHRVALGPGRRRWPPARRPPRAARAPARRRGPPASPPPPGCRRRAAGRSPRQGSGPGRRPGRTRPGRRRAAPRGWAPPAAAAR